MNNKVQIEKLNNNNYFTWKYQMELGLISEDLWEVVSEEAPSDGRALRGWVKKDNKARALIGLNVEKDQLIHIRDKNTAAATWNSLKTIHEKDTLTNKISLYKRIAQIKLKNGENVEQHINQIISMFQKLQDLGSETDEQWKIGMILASLPSTFAPLITALEARNQEDLTFNMVLMKISDEAQRQKGIETSGEYSNAEEKVLQIKKEKQFCHFCKKENHSMDNCFKFKLSEVSGKIRSPKARKFSLRLHIRHKLEPP